MAVKNFEEFARTMNNNANVNFGIKPNQIGATAAGTTPTTPEGNAVSGALNTASGSTSGANRTLAIEDKPTTPTTETPTETTPAETGTESAGFVSQMDPKKSYEQWVTDSGFGDLDKQYADAQNDLEYEFMKESASYGQKAEQLAQMGLQTSGVSDVYQLGAYQNYTKAQNDLYNDLIDRKKALRTEYNAYSDSYDSALKAEEQAYNAEQEAKAQQKQQILGELYSKYVGSYTPANANTVRADLAALGYGDYADEIIANLDNTYNSLAETDRPDYFNAKQVAAGIELEVFKDSEGNLIPYTGSADQRALVKKYLEANGMGDKTDTVLAELAQNHYDNSLTTYDQTLTAAQNGDVSVSASAYADEMKSIQNNADWNERQKADLSAKLRKSALAEINTIINGTDLNDAYAFCGVDKATWDAKDDGDKMLMILDRIGGLKNAGVLSAPKVDIYFKEWADSQIENIEKEEDYQAFKEQVEDFANKGYISIPNMLIEKAHEKILPQQIEEIQKEESWNAFAQGMANIGMN